MKRNIVYATLLAFYVMFRAAALAADDFPSKVYPTATEQSEFESQVENLLKATTTRGEGFGGPYDRESENRVRQDPRDWESALARLLNDPGKYGFKLGEAAISVVRLRGTFHNDKIVSSCEVYFGEVVKDEINKVHEFEYRGEKVPYWVGDVGSILSQLLEFHDSRILRMILHHLSSNEALKLGRLNKVLLDKIPVELRACGDISHRAEAVALAQRLREAGQKDVANDIEMWAQRVGVNKFPIKGGKVEQSQASDGHPVSSDANGIPQTIPWKAVWFSVALVLIASGLIAWRRLSKR